MYRGNDTEDEGEDYLIEQKGDFAGWYAKKAEISDNFRWFGHMWSHLKSITFDSDEGLCQYMQHNKDFAVEHNLPLVQGSKILIFCSFYHAVPYHRSWLFGCTTPCWCLPST